MPKDSIDKSVEITGVEHASARERYRAWFRSTESPARQLERGAAAELASALRLGRALLYKGQGRSVAQPG
jgi:hypothetical protein